MPRNKRRNVFKAVKRLALMKILCYSFLFVEIVVLIYSDKSFNEDHVADYNLGCLLLFSPVFISFFYVIPILQNVEKSV